MFPLQISRLRLTPAAGRLCTRSHRGFAFRSFAEGGSGDGEALLSSSLLFSPLTFSCPRAPFSAPGQHHPAGALQGSRRAGLMVRLLTGDPGSSPEAAFSEIPLCPGGGSREKETREAPWLLVSRWLRISRGRELSCEPSPSLLIFRLTSFSASSGGSGSRQGQRSVCRPC